MSETMHKQAPCGDLGFDCDEQLVELLLLLNQLGIKTYYSCQEELLGDMYVVIDQTALPDLLALLLPPIEAYEQDERPPAFDINVMSGTSRGSWRYAPTLSADHRRWTRLAVSFPPSDLAELVSRLRRAADHG